MSYNDYESVLSTRVVKSRADNAIYSRLLEAQGGYTTRILSSIGFIGSFAYLYKNFDLPVKTMKTPAKILVSIVFARFVANFINSTGAVWWGNPSEYFDLKYRSRYLVRDMEIRDGIIPQPSEKELEKIKVLNKY